MPNESAPTKRCDASQIKVGERLSRTQYYEVLEIDEEKGMFTVSNEQGFKFKLTTGVLEAEMYSARQYTQERKITRSELADLLENAGDTCFTVTFLKQATDKGVAEKLAALDTLDALDTDRKRRKFARDLLAGEQRELVGYLYKLEPKLGRSMVIDLEIPAGKHNIRMVDHRTVLSVIYKNTLYTCS